MDVRTTADAPPGDIAAAGQRISALLDASAAQGALARERAEELVRLVTDLYGAGLERLLDILYDCGRLDDEALDALAADELVASLLLVHGLHPYDVTTRVERALEGVRPYLGSHGGDVELLGVTAAGVARLRLVGSCDGCPSSAVTLELAVKDAVEAAAPEVTAIEVSAAVPAAGSGGVIPVSALRARIAESEPIEADGSDHRWEPVRELDDLSAGELRAVHVGGVPVVVARVGSQRYAYRDRCARCGGSLAAARLERRLGGPVGDAVLSCPGCGAHFDACRAGIGLDDQREHLEPLPLLLRDGVLAVAVPTSSSVPA